MPTLFREEFMKRRWKAESKVVGSGSQERRVPTFDTWLGGEGAKKAEAEYAKYKAKRAADIADGLA